MDETQKGLIAAGTLIATLLTAPRIDRGILIGLVLSLIGYFSDRFQLNKALTK